MDDDARAYATGRGGGKREEMAVLAAIMMREGVLEHMNRGNVERDDATGRARVALQLCLLTVRVVEAIEDWRRSFRAHQAQPFDWRGSNYLLKVFFDFPAF